MDSYADSSLWEKEQEFLNVERLKYPEQFTKPVEPSAELLKRIGILENFPERPEGYVKYSPLDFIVEEITPQGEVIAVDDSSPASTILNGTGTVYADLVKVGISTLDAVKRLADALKCDIKKIGYAGIKDAVALTAQKLSFRGIPLEAVLKINLPNLFLKNISEGKGVINVGDLSGNRFTLFIRTKTELGKEKFADLVQSVGERGVMNYYGIQRFGSPRFLSHVFGKYLLRGDLEGMVRIYLTETSPFEWPYMTRLRSEAKNLYGNWNAMKEIFKNLPYTFRFENLILDILIKESGPDKYEKVVYALDKQIDLWARAYASWLANLSLSEIALNGKAIESIPLLLGLDSKAHEFYREFLIKDGTSDFLKNLRPFSFIHIGKSPAIPTRVKPKIHGFKIVPEGVAISFDLPKAAYATTVLTFMFDIISGLPVPEWVKMKEYDTKELLERGDTISVRSRLGKFIDSVISRKEGGE